MFTFPISGVETHWWLPILVAFGVSCLTSTAGLSGAFVLLPFQVSVLRFTSPGVTPTNLIFNIIAIPGGVWRLYKEKRMVWPLVWTMSLGTVPGVLLGVIIRVRYLPDPGLFKLFVGCVLLYIAGRLFWSLVKKADTAQARRDSGKFMVTPIAFTPRIIEYDFNGQVYRVSTIVIFLLSAIVGVIGGIYGIGGGAILAPFLVTIFRLPVHTISGAALCSTFFTSVVGVLFYIFIAPFFSPEGVSTHPDWLLGAFFGIGGLLGIYLGALTQKYLPATFIKFVLGGIMIYISARYIIGYFA